MSKKEARIVLFPSPPLEDLPLATSNLGLILGPKCDMDWLIFLGGEWLDLGTLWSCLLAWWSAIDCELEFSLGFCSCIALLFAEWFAADLGLERASKRDMETALPGDLSMRVPGVLDLERPEAGEAELKVIVGIKSVLLRWAELPGWYDWDM